MGFLYPNRSAKDSKKLGPAHWIKVCFLFLIVFLLTWYGKFYKPEHQLTYINDFAVWIIPTQNGLSALVALPNDNNDSNNVKTGLRIWISPPDSVLAFERKSAARYRGKNIVTIGDTLNENLKQALLSTLPSGGNLYWLGPLDVEQIGEDVKAELKIFNLNPQDYVLDLEYEGCKLKFFGSQTAFDSTKKEPLSVAILMFERSVFMNLDSSRIELDVPETMALISFHTKKGLRANKLRLKGWEY